MWWIIGSLLGITLDKSTKEERAEQRAKEWRGGDLLRFLILLVILVGLGLWAWHWLAQQIP
jgi:hypothetical protein